MMSRGASRVDDLCETRGPMPKTTEEKWGSDFTHMVVRRSSIVDRPERSPSPEPRRAAPFGLRVAATVVDAVLILALIAGPLWYIRHRMPSHDSYCARLIDRLYSCRQYAARDVVHLRQAAVIIIAAVLFTVWLVPLGRTGRTLGRWLFGVRVVDFRTGAPIGYIRAVFRSLMEVFSVGIAGVGIFNARFDRYSQTWHDIVTRSVSIAEDL